MPSNVGSCAERCGVMTRTHGYIHTSYTHTRARTHTHTSTGTERCDLSKLVSKVDDAPDAADSNFAVELFHSSATGSQNKIDDRIASCIALTVTDTSLEVEQIM